MGLNVRSCQKGASTFGVEWTFIYCAAIYGVPLPMSLTSTEKQTIFPTISDFFLLLNIFNSEY